MASHQDFVDYVTEQLRDAGAIRSRKMFGEYMVYLQDRPILLVCDNTVFVKELPELEILMEQAPRGYPYGGAKKHYILDIEAPDLLRQVIPILEKVIPLPKPKEKKADAAAGLYRNLLQGRSAPFCRDWFYL